MTTTRARKGVVRRAASGLRAWRKERGASAAECAADFGVAQQLWAAWECATKRPSLLNALALENFTHGAVRYERWDYPEWTLFVPVVARRQRELAATAVAS